MLLVQTFIAPSAIEGMGVFAAEPIAAGARLWTFNADFDRLVPREALLGLPAPTQCFMERYAYFDVTLGGYLLDGDHSRFLNHCEDPAIAFLADGDGYARRDIAPGEELTCDYRDFMDADVAARHAVPAFRPSPPAAGRPDVSIPVYAG